ncbi:hypothetical protein JD969_03100 [Planctomycetota bacterium]|nr:hypothetical protein JD969_03100 [Planctomycetota bacterium]
MSEQNQQSSPNPSVPSKKRKLGVILASIIVLILFFILILPTLISTGPGTSIALRIANSQIPGTIKIKSLSIGWISGQYIEGLQLLDPNGDEVLTLQSLQLPDISLGSLISGSRDIGNVNLDALQGNIIQLANGRTNLDEAVAGPEPVDKAKKADSEKKVKKPANPGNPLAGLSFALNAKQIDVKYQFSDIEPIALNVPNTVVDFKNPADITLNMNGSIAQGGSNGKIDVNATAKDLLDNAAQLQFQSAYLDISASITDLPIDALDRIAAQNGKLLALIGPKLDTTFKATGNLSNLMVALNTTSQNINAKADLTSDGSTIQATSPASFALRITPDSWKKLSQDQGGNVNSTLEKPVTVTLTLSKLEVPLRDNLPYLNEAQTEVNFDISQLLMTASDVGTIDLRRTTATLQSDSLGKSLVAHLNSVALLNDKRGEIMIDGNIQNWLTPDNTFAKDQYTSSVNGRIQQFPLASILDDLLGESNLYMQALGSTVDSTINAEYDASQSSGLAKVKLTTAHGYANVEAELSPEEYKLTPNTIINYNVQPQLLQTATGSEELALAVPANVILSVEQLNIDANQPTTPAGITAAVTLKVDQIAPVTKDLRGITIDNLTFYMAPNTKLDAPDVPIHLAAKINDGNHTSDLTGNIHVAFKNNSWSDLQFDESRIAVENLSVDLIDRVATGNTTFVDLLGPVIDSIQVKATGDLTKQLVVNTTIKSPALSGDITGRLDTKGKEQTIDIDSNSVINYTLSPARYAAYTKQQNKNTPAKDRLKLLKPVSIAFQLTDGSIPVVFTPQKTRLSAKFTATEIAMQRGSDQDFYITDTTATMSANDLTKPLSLNINADILQRKSEKNRQPKSSIGKIRSKTVVSNLYGSDGKLDTQNLIANMDTDVSSMPIDLLDQISRYDGSLVALIGPTANLTLKGNFPGDIDLDINSETLNVPAYVNITRDYVLTLRQDFDAQMKPTPQTFSVLLAKAQPILADAIRAEKPIRLLIKKERFALPLTDFKTQNFNMIGRLDLGAVVMKRQGWLMQGLNNTIGQLGIPFGNNNKNAQTYVATFTPMDIVINKGVIEPSQVWMTSQDMAIGFQVRANLNNNKLNAFMGIMGATFSSESVLLSQSFNADQIYNVPISGTLDNPKPDWGFLLLNVAGTTSTKALADNTGDIGRAIGGIFGGVGKSMNEDKLKKAGLKAWNPPPAAIALAESVKPATKNASPEQQKQRQQDEQRRRNNDPVRKLLDGIFR